MIDISIVQDALYDWVVRATGLPAANVYWADQNGHVPDGLIVVLRVAGLDRASQHAIVGSYTPGDYKQTVQGYLLIDLELRCFGDSSNGLFGCGFVLDQVVQSRYLTSYKERFDIANIGINSNTKVITNSGTEASRQQPVASCNFTITVVSSTTESVDWIDTIKTPTRI